MSNLLAGLLVPAIIGISLFLSLYPKKKKVTRQSPSVEFKMPVSKDHFVVPKRNTLERPSLQIRIPKLVE